MQPHIRVMNYAIADGGFLLRLESCMYSGRAALSQGITWAWKQK